MIDSIVQQDIATLLDGWIEAERNGIEFPVPFDLAWGIAGYSRKDHAKRRLLNQKSRLIENRDYLPTSGESSPEGRSSDSIQLSCDAFKQFCLLAETEKGDNIRQYFIETEKKWRLVQQVAPQVAQEIEILKIKQDIARLEARKAVADSHAIGLRHLVVTTQPKPIADRILGVTEIQSVEYRDRVILNDRILDEGDTINKTGLCDRYNIKTRGGSPDFKRLNMLLEGAKLPLGAWEETTTIRSNFQLRREYLDSLDRHIVGTTRQLHVGE
jgi:phage anti-repressor protein